MSEKEKRSEDFIENVDVARRPSTDDLREKLPPSGSAERALAERKLVRKLDMRLLPTIFLIFIMNYIDRNGITTARLKGMQQDLNINGEPGHHHDHLQLLILGLYARVCRRSVCHSHRHPLRLVLPGPNPVEHGA
jgi:hypothetical protein